MKPCLVVVDLLRDTFDMHPDSFIVKSARAFIPRLNALIDAFHKKAFPVIFACDSFLPEDFIFKGKMEPHSLRGTPGESVIDELNRNPEDHVLFKRRFSAFFKTDLDQTLRTFGVDMVLVTGISTQVCVLTTALDAICHDFRTVIVEDCCTAQRPQDHKAALDLYRRTALYPLLQVMNSEQCLEMLV